MNIRWHLLNFLKRHEQKSLKPNTKPGRYRLPIQWGTVFLLVQQHLVNSCHHPQDEGHTLCVILSSNPACIPLFPEPYIYNKPCLDPSELPLWAPPCAGERGHNPSMWQARSSIAVPRWVLLWKQTLNITPPPLHIGEDLIASKQREIRTHSTLLPCQLLAEIPGPDTLTSCGTTTNFFIRLPLLPATQR